MFTVHIVIEKNPCLLVHREKVHCHSGTVPSQSKQGDPHSNSQPDPQPDANSHPYSYANIHANSNMSYKSSPNLAPHTQQPIRQQHRFTGRIRKQSQLSGEITTTYQTPQWDFAQLRQCPLVDRRNTEHPGQKSCRTRWGAWRWRRGGGGGGDRKEAEEDKCEFAGQFSRESSVQSKSAVDELHTQHIIRQQRRDREWRRGDVWGATGTQREVSL